VAGAGAAPQRLSAADAYYFPHHNSEFTLPVYRVIVDDGERTRCYIDPVSGALLAKFGANSAHIAGCIRARTAGTSCRKDPYGTR
jgi:hypothetical protein